MDSDSPTIDATGPVPVASGAGRFLPGTILAGRYRMVALLGRGGMGEVYRADDLKLGHTVALKFLPLDVDQDPDRRQRFLTEVRLSLKVTHPNICRVFDVGQMEGRQFLSMEYVDGEDLASLLRRIGRLPEDKAIEIARQLCAGLAAAHDEGVLHRDIKPANIMLDGRGRAKIADFGLAGATAGIAGAEARAGTPQYMAPEQVDGGPLSERTDLYALGLVLYELFTGKRAFEIRDVAELQSLRSSAPTSPSAHVSGLNPLVERAILRCLEPDPARRPASAAALAAALPGGDPLAMAIAAGDTPSPEMVAAAGGDAGLSRRTAAILLGVALAGMTTLALLAGRVSLFAIAAPLKPPEVLVERSRDILRSVGYVEPPEDHAWGLMPQRRYLLAIAEGLSHEGRAGVAAHGVQFWYRQSPVQLERMAFMQPYLLTTVIDFEPPLYYSWEARLRLDREGWLRELTVVSPQYAAEDAPARDVDWTILFRAAGLDPAAFIPADPRWLPTFFADQRIAWRPRTADPSQPTRIDAAALRGRPVHFSVIYSWTTAYRDTGTVRTTTQRAGNLAAVLLLTALIVAAALVARRNLRLDRADRSGALRLAIVVMALWAITWVLEEHHLPSIWEAYLAMSAAGFALLAGALIGTVYLALEPHVRRKWPGMIVSWSRLIAGNIRDPLVARDVLIGCAAAGVIYSIELGGQVLAESATGILALLDTAPRPLLGGAYIVSTIVSIAVLSVFFSLTNLFLLFSLRQLLRLEWAAVGVAAFLVSVPQAVGLGAEAIRLPTALLRGIVEFALLSRVGLVAMLTTVFVKSVLTIYPVTWPLTAWYSKSGLVGLLVTSALAIGAFRISTAARGTGLRGA